MNNRLKLSRSQEKEAQITRKMVVNCHRASSRYAISGNRLPSFVLVRCTYTWGSDCVLSCRRATKNYYSAVCSSPNVPSAVAICKDDVYCDDTWKCVELNRERSVLIPWKIVRHMVRSYTYKNVVRTENIVGRINIRPLIYLSFNFYIHFQTDFKFQLQRNRKVYL